MDDDFGSFLRLLGTELGGDKTSLTRVITDPSGSRFLLMVVAPMRISCLLCPPRPETQVGHAVAAMQSTVRVTCAMSPQAAKIWEVSVDADMFEVRCLPIGVDSDSLTSTGQTHRDDLGISVDTMDEFVKVTYYAASYVRACTPNLLMLPFACSDVRECNAQAPDSFRGQAGAQPPTRRHAA